jgi:RNA polymerase sigma-70 factor (ECF subfamily)
VTVALRRQRVISDDEDLAAAAAAGDDAAFAELYDRYAERVFARITRLLGPVPDREDVLQFVFLELHRAQPRYRRESSLTTILHRIAINDAHNHLRSRVRRATHYLDAELDQLIDGEPSPEDRARRREELARIFMLLERIKPDKRIAFVLVTIEGLSYEAAADLVGARPEAVKQRVLHARRELVAMIDRDERRTTRRLP